MISIATFNNPLTGDLLKSRLAKDGIESTLMDKVAFNSATNNVKNSVAVLIDLMDEERAVEIMEEIGNQLAD